MPGPVVQLPGIDAAKRFVNESPSVFDSPLDGALRMIGKMLGVDDPTSQVFGLATTMDIPGMEGGLVQQALGRLRDKAQKIKAFHGSPHDFDRFSMDKIGTGEGAQAFGHGLYFAEAEGTAKTYRDDLSRVVPAFDGQPVRTTAESMAHDILKHDGPDKALEKLDEYVRGGVFRGRNAEKTIAEVRQAIEANRGKVPNTHAQGRMYEVAIDASPDEFLDWDKPLSQQPPKVQEALRKAGVYPPTERAAAWDTAARRSFGQPYESLTGPDAASAMLRGNQAVAEDGREAYQTLVNRTGSYYSESGAPGATQALNAQGVKGIRYQDAMSRGPEEVFDVGAPRPDFGPYSHYRNRADAEAQLETLRKHGFHDAEIKPTKVPQTHNYVVFDDKLISIVRKYGVAGALGAGYTKQQIDAAMAAQGAQQ